MYRLFIGVLLGALVPGACLAAEGPAVSEKLKALDVTLGKWVFQGETLAVADQKAEKWNWLLDCSRSTNRAFVICSYTMNYPNKTVKSEIVDAYNSFDQKYWHYEMFDSDDSGAKPFISEMTIAGDTWTNFGKEGETTYRVTYRFVSPTRVSLRVESTTDNVAWTTLQQAEGVKQS
jgi:hypothetical protein